MKIDEVTVSARKSFSYQSFEVQYHAVLEEGDKVDEVTKQMQALARKRATEQIDIERGKK